MKMSTIDNNSTHGNLLPSISYRYQVDIPIPAYSLGLAIGEFDVIPDKEMPKRITTFAPKTNVEYCMEDLNDATECLSSAVRFFEKTFDCPLPSYCHKLVFVKNVPCVNSFASSTYSSMTIVSTDHLYPKSMHIPNNNSDGTNMNINAGNNHIDDDDKVRLINNHNHASGTSIRIGINAQNGDNGENNVAMINNSNRQNFNNGNGTSSKNKDRKTIEISNVDLAGEIAVGVAWNYFGALIQVERWQDAWLPLGLSIFMSDLFIRHVFGEKQYQLRLRKRM